MWSQVKSKEVNNCWTLISFAHTFAHDSLLPKGCKPQNLLQRLRTTRLIVLLHCSKTVLAHLICTKGPGVAYPKGSDVVMSYVSMKMLPANPNACPKYSTKGKNARNAWHANAEC